MCVRCALKPPKLLYLFGRELRPPSDAVGLHCLGQLAIGEDEVMRSQVWLIPKSFSHCPLVAEA